jgi:type II secretory pathway pseudopilin PulG
MLSGKAPRHVRCRGFTLLVVLALVALSSLVVAVAAPWMSQELRRERERELWRVGLLYAQALAAYRDTQPGSAGAYPLSFDELLRDPRVSGVLRHLRELYPDPLRPDRPWGLLRDEYGRIVGVHSHDERTPLSVGSVVLSDRTLPPAQRYADWKFMALPNSR